MRKKSVILTKVNLQIANEYGLQYLLTPKYENGIEALKKLTGDIEAELSQSRNLAFHCKLFAICSEFINNDFFIELIDHFIDIREAFNIQLTLSNTALQTIRAKYKDDVYSFIYVCKYLFLPFEEVMLPSGEVVCIVASINFKEMDNIEFKRFYDNVIDLIAFTINRPRHEIEGV